MKVLHELLPGDLRIEDPVKVGKEFDSLDPRHPHEMFNPFLLLFLLLFSKEGKEELLLLLGERGTIGDEPEGLPEIR